MATTHVPARARTLYEQSSFTGREHLKIQVLFIRAWTGPDSKEQTLCAGQQLRPAMAHFAFGAIDRGHRLRRAAGGGDFPHAASIGRHEVDRVVQSPSAAH